MLSPYNFPDLNTIKMPGGTITDFLGVIHLAVWTGPKWVGFYLRTESESSLLNVVFK
jgi:hypothetical protein